MFDTKNGSVITYICHEADEGRMISEILRHPLALYAGTIRSLKANGGIRLNGQPARVGTRVQANDQLCLNMNCGETLPDMGAEEIPLEILYEDSGLMAVNKPAGMVVHPTVFHQKGTLANALVHYWKTQDIQSGLHFVSRLDLGTSGVILIARNGYVQEHLRRQAAGGIFHKIYRGFVRNDRTPHLKELGYRGTISLPIQRKAGSIMEREVSPEGSPAVTHYKVLGTSNILPVSLLEFRLETGRTHQIRVHCKYSDCPLVGDTLYGTLKDPSETLTDLHLSINRQALHAYEASFVHPVTGKPITVTAPLSRDLQQLSQTLGLSLSPQQCK